MATRRGSRTPPAALSILERAVNTRSRRRYVLKLYVAGMTHRSVEAIRAAKAFCEEHLSGRYVLEVVDIYRFPRRAREAQIIAAPTLVKNLPLPLRRLIGDLTDANKLFISLDLSATHEKPAKPTRKTRKS
jgi:circadian clock protein KaiB